MSRTQNLCPQQMLRAQANGETFVSAIMCPRLPGPLGGALYPIPNEMLPLRFDLDDGNLLW